MNRKLEGSQRVSELRALRLQERSWSLQAEGRFDEAAQATRTALRLIEEVAGAQSPEVANLLSDLADVEHQRGGYALALALAQRAWRIEHALGRGLFGETAARLRTRTLSVLGVTHRTLGEYLSAETYFEEALSIAVKGLGETSEEAAAVQNELGMLYRCWGRFDAAERLHESALSSAAALYGENSLACAGIYRNIGALLNARGVFGRAKAPAQRAWDISRRLQGEEDLRTVLAAVTYGAVLQGLKRYEECEPIYLRAAQAFERVFGDRHVQVAALLHNRAAMAEARGDPQRAELLYRCALEMRAELLGDAHPDLALTRSHLGRLLAEQGRGAEARRLLGQAVAVLRALGSDHPELSVADAQLAAVGGWFASGGSD